MQKNSLQIVWLSLTIGCASCLYFLTLILHLNFLFTVLLAVTAGIILYRYIVADFTVDFLREKKSLLAYFFLAAGLFLLVNRSFYLSEKYGGWDGWAIWNLHAKFLVSPEYWTAMLDGKVSPHPDYPFFLPGIIAFFWRIIHSTSNLVPFSVSVLISILIPVFIYLELYGKNLVIAALTLFWFATDDFYIERCLSQFADHSLAFFFLCSFICSYHFEKTRKAKFLVFTGAFLGLCIWTKNEGMMLALVFVLFNLKVLFAKTRIKYFAAGISLPLATYIIFKAAFAPVNDLIMKKRDSKLSFLTDGSRYSLIGQYLKQSLNNYFAIHQFALLLYMIYGIKKKLVDKDILIISACFLGYMLVYVFTPVGIEWHLQTSLSRVLFHLSPAFIYVVARRLSGITLDIFRREEGAIQ